MGRSKYAEDIATIKADTRHVLEHLKKLNSSQGKQWEAINKNDRMIGRLEERVGIFAIVQAGISASLAAAAAWLGMRR